ncbi:MAG: recombinase family protein [Corallococcus sp.]|nr:recombinase family protein [Corallococcus sp.]MCM1359743.1 recombinase family protein [Corallococcus sp.]MCM1395452.1 recombinase family protein [Corallococcus sp.]
MKFAYARVSTKEQNLDRQLLAFEREGVPKSNVYCDKQSGKDFNRTNYLKMRKRIGRGDLLILHSLDRLGRDYDMILDEWRYLTVTVGCDIVVLDFTLLDTRERKGDLTGKLICNIVLELLSYIAQSEREKIRARQREGIDAAKLRGVAFGRPQIIVSEEDMAVLQKYLDNSLSGAEAALLMGISQSTFYRRAKALGKSLKQAKVDNLNAVDATEKDCSSNEQSKRASSQCTTCKNCNGESGQALENANKKSD